MNKALQPNRNTSHCTGKKKGTGKVYYILTLGTGTDMQVNKGEQVKVKLLIIYMQSCILKYGKMNTNPRVMKIYFFLFSKINSHTIHTILFFLAGSLISPKWVLSAAHCTYIFPFEEVGAPRSRVVGVM